MSLFEELSRRNVIRVAIAYCVVGWLVAQVAELALDSFGAPAWVMKTLLLLISIGLPIAVLFAWAFEMTPEGVKREKDVDRSQSITHETGRKLNGIIIGTLAVALAFSVYTHRWASDAGDRSPIEVIATAQRTGESIAVLPFVNMSDDPANEFFSDGISEELLNVLVRIEGLKVASRTSSFAFKGKDASIPVIAESLGVDHVLEGSVRKAGQTVRVTAQLIDARTDKHIWSETYDRQLEDIFAIQDEISAHIVEALKNALGATDKQKIDHASKPTEDLDAYQDYLRGRYLWQRRGEENIRNALELFKSAVERDPQFARAWSSRAAAHITMLAYSSDAIDLHLPFAKEFAQKALSLDDKIAEAHAVLGDVARSNNNWKAAEASYRRALKVEPNNATANIWYAEHLMCAARIDDALEFASYALELDPLHPGIHQVISDIYYANHETDRALRHAQTAWELGHNGSLFLTLSDEIRNKDWRNAAATAALIDEKSRLDIDLGAKIVTAFQSDNGAEEILAVLKSSNQVRLRWFIAMFADLGDLDTAFTIARDGGGIIMNDWFQIWGPGMGKFRQDPRFISLIQDTGLVGYWDEFGWPPFCERTDAGVVCQ